MVQESLRVYFETMQEDGSSNYYCETAQLQAVTRACAARGQSEILSVYKYCRKQNFSHLSALYAFNRLVMGCAVHEPTEHKHVSVKCSVIDGNIVFQD
jgi:hypothetical protein